MTSNPAVLSLLVSNNRRIVHRTAMPPCWCRAHREALPYQPIPLDDALGHHDHVGATIATDDRTGNEYLPIKGWHSHDVLLSTWFHVLVYGAG